MYPTTNISSVRGSNRITAFFLALAVVYAVDTMLYLEVYRRWERRMIDQEETARRHAGRGQHGSRENELAEETERTIVLEDSLLATDATIAEVEGARLRPVEGSRADYASSSSAPFHSNLLLARMHSFLTHHIGFIINCCEVFAALLCVGSAFATLIVGLSGVQRDAQRGWDHATMSLDAVAAAIFLGDSIAFQYIYRRSMFAPRGAKDAHVQRRVSSACLQAHDPYFWTSVANILGSALYFAGSTWGALQQNAIAKVIAQTSKEGVGYDAAMLPMVINMRIILLTGDVF
jgi:hypothetical protein